MPQDRAQEAGVPAAARRVDDVGQRFESRHPADGPNEGHVLEEGQRWHAATRVVRGAGGENGLIPRRRPEAACAPVDPPLEQPVAETAGLGWEGEAEATRARAGPHGRPQGGRAPLREPGVGVEEDEDATRGRARSGAELRATASRGAEHRAVALRDLLRAVAAAAVDDEHLGVRTQGGLGPAQRLRDPSLLVQRGNDEGELRCCGRTILHGRRGVRGGVPHPAGGVSRNSRRTPPRARGCRKAMRAPPAPVRSGGGTTSAPAASALATAASRSGTRTQT